MTGMTAAFTQEYRGAGQGSKDSQSKLKLGHVIRVELGRLV